MLFLVRFIEKASLQWRKAYANVSSVYIQPFSRYLCKTTSSRLVMIYKLVYMTVPFTSVAKVIVKLIKTKKICIFSEKM